MDLLRSRTTIVVAAAVLLIAIVGAGWLAFRGSPTPTPQPSLQSTITPSASPSPTPVPTPIPSITPEPEARCPLNGLAMANPNRAARPTKPGDRNRRRDSNNRPLLARRR